MAIYRHPLFAGFALWLLTTGFVMAQDDSSSLFQCGVLDDESNKPLPSTVFDRIDVTFNTLDIDNGRHLVPEKIHWHVYAIPDGEVAQYSCFPEGLVQPKVSGTILKFMAKENVLKDLGYSNGDNIEAGVNIYIPASQLRNIQVDLVKSAAEVIATEELLGDEITNSSSLPTLNFREYGDESQLYVNAPYSMVAFKGSGVFTTTIMEVRDSSSVVLLGAGQVFNLKTDYLPSGELAGADQQMLVEGTCEDIRMSGIRIKVRVNAETGCNAVTSSGINNNCRTTRDTVTVPTLTCLASTSIITYKNNMSEGLRNAIIILAALGALVFFAVTYFCKQKRQQKEKSQQQQETEQHADANANADPKNGSATEESPITVAAEVQPVEPAPSNPASDAVGDAKV